MTPDQLVAAAIIVWAVGYCGVSLAHLFVETLTDLRADSDWEHHLETLPVESRLDEFTTVELERLTTEGGWADTLADINRGWVS